MITPFHPADIVHTTDHVSLSDGLILDNVISEGSFTNTANIFAVANGIHVKASELKGVVKNTGWLGAREAAGISIADSLIHNRIENTANITAGQVAPEGAMTSSVAGISVHSNSSVGRISNTGSVAVHAGIEHNGNAYQQGITASAIEVIGNATASDILNAGSITADTFGIYVDGEDNEGLSITGTVRNAQTGSI